MLKIENISSCVTVWFALHHSVPSLLNIYSKQCTSNLNRCHTLSLLELKPISKLILDRLISQASLHVCLLSHYQHMAPLPTWSSCSSSHALLWPICLIPFILAAFSFDFQKLLPSQHPHFAQCCCLKIHPLVPLVLTINCSNLSVIPYYQTWLKYWVLVDNSWAALTLYHTS